MELLKQNELTANKAAASVMRVTGILFVLVLILDIVGIFKVQVPTMVVAFIIGEVLLFLPTLVTNILKIQKGWVKYFTVACAVLFTTVLACVLAYHVVILYVYPIAIASLFFSTKLSMFTIVFTVLGTAGAQYVCFICGFVEDHNVDNITQLITYLIMPRTIVLIAVSAIIYVLCRRTAIMLGSLMGAEKQKEIQKKTLEISGSMADMVNELEKVSSASAEANSSISGETMNVMRDSDTNAESIKSIEQNITEISESLRSLSEMSGKIAGLTEKANEITADNDDKITAASQSMEKISASTDDTCDMILSLAAQSKKIAAISNVISDISTQTNILAINASIEASHAGEAGSGFAVVADEIKNLSEKTATAAEEIGDIISAVTNGVEKAADAMKHNAALTREGVSDMETIRRSAEHIGASNKEVTQNIEDMNSVISNVSANSETVTRELGTVSHNITGNSDALQHVAAAIEENSAGTQTLDSMVKQIKSMAAELEQLTE